MHAFTKNRGVGGVPDILNIVIINNVLNLIQPENWFNLSKYIIDLSFTEKSIKQNITNVIK